MKYFIFGLLLIFSTATYAQINLVYPRHNSTLLDDSGYKIKFRWSPHSETGYRYVLVVADASTNQKVYSADIGTSHKTGMLWHAVTVFNMKDGKRYFWRVAASKSGRKPVLSSKAYFTYKLKKPSKSSGSGKGGHAQVIHPNQGKTKQQKEWEKRRKQGYGPEMAEKLRKELGQGRKKTVYIDNNFSGVYNMDNRKTLKVCQTAPEVFSGWLGSYYFYDGTISGGKIHFKYKRTVKVGGVQRTMKGSGWMRYYWDSSFNPNRPIESAEIYFKAPYMNASRFKGWKRYGYAYGKCD